MKHDAVDPETLDGAETRDPDDAAGEDSDQEDVVRAVRVPPPNKQGRNGDRTRPRHRR